uniref:uncharacterized protein n=1 Tax=Lonchura striata TaxID=40157 RepID=UPI000B4DDBAB|nr:uncharacterized protein LOC110474319 [Lonchura striata domestica]
MSPSRYDWILPKNASNDIYFLIVIHFDALVVRFNKCSRLQDFETKGGTWDVTRVRRLTPSILLLLLSAVSSLVQHSHLPLLRVQGKPRPPGAQSCPSRDTPERSSPEPRSLNTRIISFAGGARLLSIPEAPGTRCPPGNGKSLVPVPAAPGGTSATPRAARGTPRWNLGSSCGAAARLGLPHQKRSVTAAAAATERARTPPRGPPPWSLTWASGSAPRRCCRSRRGTDRQQPQEFSVLPKPCRSSRGESVPGMPLPGPGIPPVLPPYQFQSGSGSV